MRVSLTGGLLVGYVHGLLKARIPPWVEAALTELAQQQVSEQASDCHKGDHVSPPGT